MIIYNTHKEPYCGKPYMRTNVESLKAASRTLNGEAAFKLYINLQSTTGDYSLKFSPRHFSEEYGVSLSSVYRAMRELEEKGYVIKISETEYDFFETSQTFTWEKLMAGEKGDIDELLERDKNLEKTGNLILNKKTKQFIEI